MGGGHRARAHASRGGLRDYGARSAPLDGFSTGTNDLTQLTLGVGRDSDKLSCLFDEREASVKRMVRMLIEKAHASGKKVGLGGQAPSDHPDFAEFLVEAGIDSISLNPDSTLGVIGHVAQQEQQMATD